MEKRKANSKIMEKRKKAQFLQLIKEVRNDPDFSILLDEFIQSTTYTPE